MGHTQRTRNRKGIYLWSADEDRVGAQGQRLEDISPPAYAAVEQDQKIRTQRRPHGR